MRLWFWLERPCSENEMKVWLTAYSADTRMFNTTEIHLIRSFYGWLNY